MSTPLSRQYDQIDNAVEDERKRIVAIIEAHREKTSKSISGARVGMGWVEGLLDHILEEIEG